MAKKPAPPPRKCGTCGGGGKQYANIDGRWVAVNCRACGGTGRG